MKGKGLLREMKILFGRKNIFRFYKLEIKFKKKNILTSADFSQNFIKKEEQGIGNRDGERERKNIRYSNTRG